MYACGFRISFTPLPGFFSPFPHGTGSLSVDVEYLALEDGPPIFRQGFSCPALLVASSVPRFRFRVRGHHPLRRHFPEASANKSVITCRLVPFRSPLLWESRLISFPPATEMFQFTGFASCPYEFRTRYSSRSGFPHSETSGSMLHCQLPRAFRRLARPSSPDIAKASTTCTSSLDPITLSSLSRTVSHRQLVYEQRPVRFKNRTLSMQSQPYHGRPLTGRPQYNLLPFC